VASKFLIKINTYSMSYNPIPPRVWSRLQGQCNHDTTRTPIEKGNVLQYKKNSSNLTKQQKYSQIAKGYWTSRRKCFASQTQTYTNPNTASFKRINSINIPFPNNIVGAPNNISGPFQYDVPNPFGCPTTSLEDGGTLLGTTYVNPCTNEVIRKTFVQNCNPTSDSDVPGPIETLCWDPSVATWYPRQRLNMSNSSDKWPVGYKGFVSAITPIPPVLYYDGFFTLYWIYEYCLPVSSTNIYKDGQLYKVVPAPLTSCPLNDLDPCYTYIFTAKSVLYGTESEVSNSVTVTLQSAYEVTGSYSFQTIGDSHIITFTGSGTFTSICQLSSVGIICVGGGGGGGGGSSKLITAEGGGGGSGAVITMSDCTIPIGSYSIVVGSGGSGGVAGITGGIDGTNGGNGQTTSFGASVSSTGGEGGKCATVISPTATGGNIGNCTLNTIFSSNQIYTSLPGIYSDASYNGQGGGGNVNGFESGSNGNNTYVTLYSGPVNYIQSDYGGGGGGGKIDGRGGAAGSNGVGGTLGGSTDNNGVSAGTYGSGGGGGGFPISSVGGDGGDSGPGILIITIPNTYSYTLL
jgi:hypothetical protein